MFKNDYGFNSTKLVKAVEKHKCLYDCTMREPRYREIIQNAWDEVATEVGLGSTAKVCKDSWRSLRIAYNRCLKNPLSVPKATPKQLFLLHNMDFLKRCMRNMKMERKKLSSHPQSKKRNTPSKPTASQDKNQNVEDNKPHSSNAHNLTVRGTNSMVNKTPKDSSSEPPPKKSNAQNTSAESSESKTEDRDSTKQQFLLSLLPDLEEMDAKQFRIFRLNACDLINNILASKQTIPKSSDDVLSLAEPQQEPQIFGEVSSMTRPLVSPQPIPQSIPEVSPMAKPLVAPESIPQSSNEVSSMPKKSTSSSSIALKHQADPWIYIDEDSVDDTRAASCKVEVSF